MQLRTRTVRALSAGALVLSAPLLSACGMGYATDEVYTPGVGVNDRDGRVDVLSAVVVAAEDGSGTFVATLVNNEDPEFQDGALTDPTDELTGLSGAGETTLTADLEPVEIPAGGVAKLADETGIPVEGESIEIGRFIEVVLTFAEADPVRIEVPVVPNNGAYAGQDGDELTPTTAEEFPAEEGEEH